MSLELITLKRAKKKAWQRVSKVSKDLICEKTIEGQSLRKICKATKSININLIEQLRLNDAEFESRYRTARQIYADEIFYSLHNRAKDLHKQALEEFEENDANLPHSVLRATQILIETEKFIIAKLSPNVYGDTKEEGNLSQSVNIYIDNVDASL